MDAGLGEFSWFEGEWEPGAWLENVGFLLRRSLGGLSFCELTVFVVFELLYNQAPGIMGPGLAGSNGGNQGPPSAVDFGGLPSYGCSGIGELGATNGGKELRFDKERELRKDIGGLPGRVGVCGVCEVNVFRSGGKVETVGVGGVLSASVMEIILSDVRSRPCAIRARSSGRGGLGGAGPRASTLTPIVLVIRFSSKGRVPGAEEGR